MVLHAAQLISTISTRKALVRLLEVGFLAEVLCGLVVDVQVSLVAARCLADVAVVCFLDFVSYASSCLIDRLSSNQRRL